MKRITRTFRIPADLVERFDRAAELDGLDKTEVVVKAIQDYVAYVERKHSARKTPVKDMIFYASEQFEREYVLRNGPDDWTFRTITLPDKPEIKITDDLNYAWEPAEEEADRERYLLINFLSQSGSSQVYSIRTFESGVLAVYYGIVRLDTNHEDGSRIGVVELYDEGMRLIDSITYNLPAAGTIKPDDAFRDFAVMLSRKRK